MSEPFREFLEQEITSRFDLRRRAIPTGLDYRVSDLGKHPATIQS